MANKQVKIFPTNSVSLDYVVIKNRCQPDITWFVMPLMEYVPIFYREEKTMCKNTMSHQISS